MLNCLADNFVNKTSSYQRIDLYQSSLHALDGVVPIIII